MNEFNNSAVKMKYSPENKIISGFWKKNPASNEIREAMEYTIRIAKEHQTGRLFYDPANLGTIHDNDKHWITQVFIPQIISAVGYVKIANVVPIDVFTKISRQEILTASSRMSSWYFDSDENAIEWLKEENNQVKDLIRMYPCDLI
jgi:hypothetical protein